MVSGKRPILKEEFEDTKSEPVNQRRTDNTMTKKKTKEQTTIYKNKLLKLFQQYAIIYFSFFHISPLYIV
jgi:hypothetical protein